MHRYYSREVEEMVQKLKEARERQDQAIKLFQYTVRGPIHLKEARKLKAPFIGVC